MEDALSDEPFDPELDYAQLLAEARSYFAKGSYGHPQLTKSTCTSDHGSYVQAESNLYRHLLLVHLQQSLTGLKLSRSWKSYLLFWRKPKKQKRFHNCTTPQHPTDWPRSKTTSAPLSTKGNPKRLNVGPIYTIDGPSATTKRSIQTSSGPIGGSMTLAGRSQFHTPYVQLQHRAFQVSLRAPLYVVS